MNLGELIEERVANKKAIDEINTRLKELNQEKSDLDYRLVSTLDDTGQTKAANDAASVSIKEETVPTVVDWDKFFDWLSETKNFEIMQRRLSSIACRELWALGVDIPGVEQRDLRKILMRIT